MLFKLALAIFLRNILFVYFHILYFSNKIKIVKNNNANINCLLLNIERFNPDDLNVMINDKNFNYFSFPSKFQDVLFILSESRLSLIKNYIFSSQKNYFKSINHNRGFVDPTIFGRIFLNKILLKILNRSKINFVLTCGAYYRRNRNWEFILSKTKIPIFCLHKESTGISEKINNLLNTKSLFKLRKLQYYQGNKIFVSNEHTKSLFNKLEFFPTGDIEVIGSIKVDKLIKDNLINNNKNNEDIDVTFFSFYHTYLLPDKINLLSTWSKNKDFGFSRLFDSTHYLIGKFAKENPDKQIRIKIKWHDDQTWVNYIKKSMSEKNINIKEIKNLKIDYETSSHDLINRSKIIVGFNSSILSETLLFNKTAIIPCYEEAGKKYNDFILWKNSKSFLFANSETHFMQLLNEFTKFKKKISFEDKNEIIYASFGFIDGENMKRLSDSILIFLKTFK